jgi:hypothetical protein
LCEFGDTLGGCDGGNLEVHLEAVMERVSRPESSEFRDALDPANLEAIIE